MKRWRVVCSFLLILVLIAAPLGCRKNQDPGTDPNDDPNNPNDPGDDDSEAFGGAALAFIRNGDVYLWTGQNQEQRLTTSGNVQFIQWSSDGTMLLILRAEGHLSLVKGLETQEILLSTAAHFVYPNPSQSGYLWQPAGSIIAFIENNDTLVLYDTLDSSRQEINLDCTVVSGPWWSVQGNYLSFTGSENESNSIYTFDSQGNSLGSISNAQFQGWSGNSLLLSAEIYEDIMGQYFYNNIEISRPDGTQRQIIQNDVWSPSAKATSFFLAIGLNQKLMFYQLPGFAKLSEIDFDTPHTFSEYAHPPIYGWNHQGSKLAYYHYSRTDEMDEGEIGTWDLRIYDPAARHHTVLWSEIYELNGAGYIFEDLPIIYRTAGNMVWELNDQALYVLQETSTGQTDVYKVNMDGTKQLFISNASLPALRQISD